MIRVYTVDNTSLMGKNAVVTIRGEEVKHCVWAVVLFGWLVICRYIDGFCAKRDKFVLRTRVGFGGVELRNAKG